MAASDFPLYIYMILKNSNDYRLNGHFMYHLPYIGLIDPFKPLMSALRLFFVIYLQKAKILVEPQLDIAPTATAGRNNRAGATKSTTTATTQTTIRVRR